MLRYLVLVIFKPETSEKQQGAWTAAVHDLCKTSPEVISYSLRANVGSGPNHHEATLVADFEDIAAFRRYVSGPTHKAFVGNHAPVVVGKIAALQHET